MQLFRDEEHLGRWLEGRDDGPGATLAPDQLWRLASAWYQDRLGPRWHRPSPEAAQGLFAAIGLTGDFWDLDPSGDSPGIIEGPTPEE
ncbi:MAG TPA: hypothetical protein VGB28_03585 [Actinomycetota bacterium]|jgi:hypothetical protein